MVMRLAGEIFEDQRKKLATAGKNILKESTKSSGKGAADSMFSAPGNFVTATFTEAMKLAGGNANDIVRWTTGTFIKGMTATAKFGLQGLSLLPLPLPGATGKRVTIAGMRAEGRDISDVYALKVQGDTRRFRDIFTALRDVRYNAQRQTTGSDAWQKS